MWAIDQAMKFYTLPAQTREQQVARVMRHALENFTHSVNARSYIELYEKMLERPLLS